MMLEVLILLVCLLGAALGVSWSSTGGKLTRLLYQALAVVSVSFGCHAVALMAESVSVVGASSVASETFMMTGVSLGAFLVLLWIEKVRRKLV